VIRGLFAALLAVASPLAAAADGPDHAGIVRRAVESHVLPGMERFETATAGLSLAADAFCDGAADRTALDGAYHRAFDGWMGVAHLRFGPLEAGGRAVAIAFWPDERGATPRALAALLAGDGAALADPAAFAEVSVAARGLFAMDWLLFDAAAPPVAAGARECAVAQAVAADLAATVAALAADWRDGYAALLLTAGAPGNPVYATSDEATADLYGALVGGVEAAVALRLDRPLGAPGAPRPRRAEAWRSGRPLRNLDLQLGALEDLAAAFLPALAGEDAQAVTAAFARARERAAALPRPLVDQLADPWRRIRVETFRGDLVRLREVLTARLAPALGVSAGFNALDGD
jgi:predicted lipoprotein